ncbi:hypothetical protein [Agrococcus sp. DT81.2]|uniref:hypothetical protein n=1 Tax=Agrococcus sp. DT81.2 TaxID=3393414 RepID=UPI003CE49961
MAEVLRQYDDQVMLDFLKERRGLDLGDHGQVRVEASQLNPHPNEVFTVVVQATYKLTAREGDDMLQRALRLPD